MNEFWSNYAEAVELSVEGNRLIANEIATLVKGLWQRTGTWLQHALQGLGHSEHIPPV